jgi:hypothetical protein
MYIIKYATDHRCDKKIYYIHWLAAQEVLRLGVDVKPSEFVKLLRQTNEPH